MVTLVSPRSIPAASVNRNVLGAQVIRQPVVLVETDPSGERKVWTDADEHGAPAPGIDVELVLDDPALSELQMPADVLRVPDGDQDPGDSRPFTITTTSPEFAHRKAGSTNSSADTWSTTPPRDHLLCPG